MRCVYKLEIDSSVMELDLPKGLKVVLIGKQNGKTCMWYEFESSAPLVYTMIKEICTGIYDDKLEHIGSLIDGGLVYHYYMKQPHGFKD